MTERGGSRELRHGRLVLDVPAGWRDASSLAFVSPHSGVPELPLAAGSRAAAYHPNFGVAFERVPTGVDSPKAYLARAAAELGAAGVGFRELESAPMEVAGRAGWCSVRVLDLHATLCRQVCAVCIIDQDTMLVAAVTMPEAAAATQCETLRDLIARIRWV